VPLQCFGSPCLRSSFATAGSPCELAIAGYEIRSFVLSYSGDPLAQDIVSASRSSVLRNIQAPHHGLVKTGKTKYI
jgi:hypothetical protein